MNEKVLIVEDDDGISEFVTLELQYEGYDTAIAKTGRIALEKFESYKPDLILLDIMLPELNGMEVLRRIRKVSNIPVIIVTARGETFDRVNGLDLGADDYIPKPFRIEELLARMRAILRRISFDLSNSKNVLKVKELELTLESMEVTLSGNPINVSKTEFLLLKLFMENPNQVLSRDYLIDGVWGKDHFIDTNTIDVYVGYLRTKIDNTAHVEYIKTIRGLGFMMVDNSVCEK